MGSMEKRILNNGIYYRKSQFAARPTLVFVHGITGSSSAWLPYERGLKKEFNILAMDLRGHGLSFRPKQANQYSISNFSRDVYSVVNNEKLSGFILISHSFGNFVALDFLRKHQKLLRGMILISADAAPAKTKLARILRPLLSLTEPLQGLDKGSAKGGHVNYKKFPHSGDWNIPRCIADIKNTGLRSFLLSLSAAYRFDLESFLPKIRIPVLVIHGKKDTILPMKSGLKTSAAIPGAKFVVFGGSNHIIVLNEVPRLSREIRRFVRSLSSNTSK